MSNTVLTFSAEDGEMLQSLAKQTQATDKRNKKFKEGTRAQKEQEAAMKKLGREGVRLEQSLKTPQERRIARMQKLNLLFKTGSISLQTLGRAAKQTETAQTRAFGPKALTMVKGFVGMAGLGSVTGALMAVNRGLELWRMNNLEIASTAKAATKAAIMHAAILAPGTIKSGIMETAALGAQYGVGKEGWQPLHGMVQGIASQYGGDQKMGLKVGETILQATQLGMRMEDAHSMEILGKSQGQKPGQNLRRAYAAAQASAQDPLKMAPLAESIGSWDNPDVGWAMGAVLAAGKKPEKAPVYLRQAGIVLGGAGTVAQAFREREEDRLRVELRMKPLGETQRALLAAKTAAFAKKETESIKTSLGVDVLSNDATNLVQRRTAVEREKMRIAMMEEFGVKELGAEHEPELQRRLKKQGLGKDATQTSRLRALAREGIDTEKELQDFGVGELRQRGALMILVPNIAEADRIKGEVVRNAKPGLFAGDLARVEKEDPMFRIQREIDVEKAKFDLWGRYGPRSKVAAEAQLYEQKVGAQLRKEGKEEAFGFIDRTDAEGRTGWWREKIGKAWDFVYEKPLGGDERQRHMVGFRDHQEARERGEPLPFDRPTPGQVTMDEAAETTLQAAEKLDQVADKMLQAQAESRPALLVPPNVDK